MVGTIVPVVNGQSHVFAQDWVKNLFIANDYALGTERIAYASVNNKT